MKVFIDTNIYLSFYTSYFTNTSSLSELINQIKSKNVELILTQQVKDEFYRNKEVLSIRTRMNLEKWAQKHKVKLPDKEKNSSVWHEIKQINEKYNLDIREKLSQISKQVKENIAPGGSVDKLIEEIFNLSSEFPITTSIYEQAKYRHSIGNPPMKNDSSIGDAINWEFLLSSMKRGEDLHFIAKDPDYVIEDWEGETVLREFLKNEWEQKVGSKIHIYTKLTRFLEVLPKENEVDKKKIEIAKKEEDLVSQYTSGYDAFLNTSQLFPNYSDIIREYTEKINEPTESLKRYLESLPPKQYSEFLKSIQEQLSTTHKTVSKMQETIKNTLPKEI